MRKALLALGRLGVLGAVGAALAASDISRPPCLEPEALGERLTYEVASDCGPAGLVVLEREAYIPGRCGSPFVDAIGAAEVGLPMSGTLIDPPPETELETSRGIAAGDFYLAGPVSIPGAAPPVTVDRVCRFTPREGGALEMICIGPAEEARCTGTLTPAVEAQ
ncbi:MAG TPA: hypothetical protein VEB43_08395 [Anaeromyxobacter sp.]|nr:hypothetical protein [Anaeromyxobacter sp.]